MSSTLPTPRNLLTDLFSTPPPQTDQTSPSPAPGPLPSSLKSTILTLQILFPNELLPALDLLDRNLLTKFIVRDRNQSTPNVIEGEQQLEEERQPIEAQQQQPPSLPPPLSSKASQVIPPLYYVRSSQQSRPYNPRHGPAENQPTPHYEVRPQAWNCSCPAFAFSAFPATSSLFAPAAVQNHSNIGSEDQEDVPGSGEVEQWHFGGLSLGEGIPMCKHLLACVMVERWGGFGDGVEMREVSIEELAGWGAGWGG